MFLFAADCLLNISGHMPHSLKCKHRRNKKALHTVETLSCEAAADAAFKRQHNSRTVKNRGGIKLSLFCTCCSCVTIWSTLGWGGVPLQSRISELGGGEREQQGESESHKTKRKKTKEKETKEVGVGPVPNPASTLGFRNRGVISVKTHSQPVYRQMRSLLHRLLCRAEEWLGSYRLPSLRIPALLQMESLLKKHH